MPNWLYSLKKPSHWLGFFFVFMSAITACLICYQLDLYNFGYAGKKLILQNSDWIGIVAAFVAVTGFTVGAYVSIRNSVKQHTISTLLDSRLSTTYMEHAKVINETFFVEGKICPLTPTEMKEGLADGSITYILNYLEFIAVGIRSGDLDEWVLRRTIRGMVCNLEMALQIYIQESQKLKRLPPRWMIWKPRKSKAFEHVSWLAKKWDVEALRLGIYDGPRPKKELVEAVKVQPPTSLSKVDALYFLITGKLPR